jgi:hypothetical protein
MPKFVKQIAKPAKFLATALDGVTRVEQVLTADRLRKVAENGTSMLAKGLKIYAPWKHDFKNAQGPLGPSRLPDSSENAGFWERLWFDDKDNALYGEIDVPREEDASKIGTTVKEVSPLLKPFQDGAGNTWDADSPYHIALVMHPILAGQDNFVPVTPEPAGVAASMPEDVGFAFSMSDAQELLLTEKSHPAEIAKKDEGAAMAVELGKEDETPVEPSAPATGAGVGDAIRALAELKISLPADTTPENFIERLVIALNAIHKANEPEQDTKPPTEQPLPVAMSLGDQTVADTPAVNPLLTFAENQARKGYVDRIEAAVASGRITPAYVLKHLKPMVEGFALSLGDDGQPQETMLDKALVMIEDIPANTILNVSGAAKTGKDKKGVAFSFEEPFPDGLEGDGLMKPDSEEAIKAADEQVAKMEGRHTAVPVGA